MLFKVSSRHKKCNYHHSDKGGRIQEGITRLLGEKQGGWVVTENPKGGVAENFGRIQRGTQICLENIEMGDREIHQKLLRGITSVK